MIAAAPVGKEWLSEVKLDGYRIIASIDKGQVRLLTRKGLDWTDRMPAVANAFKAFAVGTAMLGGELVALRSDGVSSFPGLQTALKAGRDDTLRFYAFDLLHLDGWELRPCTLVDRKAALQRLSDWSGLLRFSEHVVGSPAEVHKNAGRLGFEGIVCKHTGDPYRAGRGGSWLKVKCSNREELIVLGWTPPAGSRQPARVRLAACRILRSRGPVALRGRHRQRLRGPGPDRDQGTPGPHPVQAAGHAAVGRPT